MSRELVDRLCRCLLKSGELAPLEPREFEGFAQEFRQVKDREDRAALCDALLGFLEAEHFSPHAVEALQQIQRLVEAALAVAATSGPGREARARTLLGQSPCTVAAPVAGGGSSLLALRCSS